MTRTTRDASETPAVRARGRGRGSYRGSQATSQRTERARKHSAWAASCIASVSDRVGAVGEPGTEANETSGRRVTRTNASLPAESSAIVPSASSSYRSTTNPLFAAIDRNQSM